MICTRFPLKIAQNTFTSVIHRHIIDQEKAIDHPIIQRCNYSPQREIEIKLVWDSLVYVT